MKKLTSLLLTGLFLICFNIYSNAQDVRHLKTKVADILMQMPAKNAEHLNSLLDQIIGLGDQGIAEITSMLKTPEEGDDIEVRFALTSLARYTGQPGHEKQWEWLQTNLLKAIESNTNKDIQAYLIEQLSYGATDACVAFLKKYLTDEQLCEPTVGVLVSMKSEESEKALVEVLQSVKGPNKVIIIKSLGLLESKSALPYILKFEGTSDNTLQRTVLFAVSATGDPNSYDLLWSRASKVNFRNEPTQATASFLEYLDKLGANGELQLCKKGCLEMIKANDQKDLRYNQAAALKIYSKYFEKNAMSLLLKVADNPDSSFRLAVLCIAQKLGDPTYTKQWIGKAKKANPDFKADVIYMLGERNDKSAIPFERECLNDKSEKVRTSSVWALVKLDEQLAITDLLDHMGKGFDVTESEKALSTLLDEKQLDEVVNALNISTDEGKPGFINLIAAKSGKRFFKEVYKYALSDNSSIRISAVSALKNVSGYNNLVDLFQLFPKLNDPKDIENLQSAIVNALMVADNERDAERMVLEELEKSSKKELILPVIPSVGGKKSVDAVVKLFNESGGAVKNTSLMALINWKGTEAAKYLYAICDDYNPDIHLKAFEGFVNQIKKSNLPDDQKLLKLQMIMPLAKDSEEQKLVLEALSGVRTFLSLVYVSRFIDIPELQQTAAYSSIDIATPDEAGKNGLSGDIPKGIIEKCIRVITGPESDYTKESLKKYINDMPSDKGFVSLFNGKDLNGWKPFIADPIALKTLTAKNLKEKLVLANQKMHQNWNVKDGMIVFSGEGDNLLSEKEYGDFEMIVNWRISKKGDSGIYLRGTPQVQIWDTSRVEVGAQVGSGGLYNNQVNESKPLKIADNPVGEWNTFRITMIGERVTVFLNGELVVDNIILENYWNRNIPIFPKGTVELQAHGTDLAFKDIYIREIDHIGPDLTVEEKQAGFVSLFNGKNLDGWVGDKVNYSTDNVNIVIHPTGGEGGGNLYTAKEYSDFIFRFEFKLTPGANNGLGIRAPLEGDAAYVGMELQILDNEAPVYADLKPYQYHGSVYGVIPAKRGFLNPIGEWNYEEVVVKGKNVKVILNGTVIVDGNIKEASKNGTMDHNEHPGLLREKGHIGFLGHGSVLWFRNIRVKEL